MRQRDVNSILFGLFLCCRVDEVEDNQEFVVIDIDDVLNILKSDYENAYFVTGTFIVHNFHS